MSCRQRRGGQSWEPGFVVGEVSFPASTVLEHFLRSNPYCRPFNKPGCRGMWWLCRSDAFCDAADWACLCRVGFRLILRNGGSLQRFDRDRAGYRPAIPWSKSDGVEAGARSSLKRSGFHQKQFD